MSPPGGGPVGFFGAHAGAAAGFRVTRVVDEVRGVHCLIRRADLAPAA